MDNSSLQQQADAFERERKVFEQARAKYLEAWKPRWAHAPQGPNLDAHGNSGGWHT